MAQIIDEAQAAIRVTKKQEAIMIDIRLLDENRDEFLEGNLRELKVVKAHPE